MRYSLLLAIAVLVALPAAGQIYSDVTVPAGLVLEHTLADICGPPISSGSAWADYDGDNDIDLFVTNHGGPNRLYRNDGDTDVDGTPNFTDVAVDLGLDDPLEVNTATVFADYDNDGDQDLYVAGWGGASALYQNQLVESGVATFVDVAATAGLQGFGRINTATWSDFDGDGDLDLYTARHRECSNDDNNADSLYQNNGDGTFTDVVGWLCPTGQLPCNAVNESLGFAPGWVDYDNDGDPDLYLVNDQIIGGYKENILWRNDGDDGEGGWLFTDVSTASGADIALNGMGLGVGDYDNDGWFDFAFSNIGPNYLLRNEGDGTFADVSTDAGVDRGTLPGGEISVTWGTMFLDHDNDGLLDLYIAAGFLGDNADTELQPNILYGNNGDGTFSDISAAAGVDHSGRARNISMSDFDEDGFVDIFVGNFGQPPVLFQNDAIAEGNTNHWLVVTTEGTVSNRDAIGTRLWLTTPDGVTQMREITSGPTHGGGDQKAAFFGLGANDTADLLVRWPTGDIQDLGTVGIDQYLHIVENEIVDDGMTVVGPDPGLAGEPNSFFVSGAGADSRVLLVMGRNAGAFEVPGCPGVDILIDGPRVRASEITDGKGNAELIGQVPASVAGDTVLHQVIDRTNCAVSEVISFTYPE